MLRITKVVINNPPAGGANKEADLLPMTQTSKSMGQRIKENRKRVHEELTQAAEDAVPSNAMKGHEGQGRFVNCAANSSSSSPDKAKKLRKAGGAGIGHEIDPSQRPV